MDSALESLKYSFQNFVNSQNLAETQQNAIASTHFARSLEDTLRRVRYEIRGIQDYLIAQKTKQDKVTRAVIDSIETLKQVQASQQPLSPQILPINRDEKVLAQMKQCIETQRNISQNIVNLLRQKQSNCEINQIKTMVLDLAARVTAIESGLKTNTQPGKISSLKEDIGKTRDRVVQLEEKWRSEGLSLPKPPPNPPPLP